jgi:hypothetical protein
MYPHLRPSDTADAFAFLVNQTTKLLPNQHIHWVADAAFGTAENFRNVPQDHTYTIALNLSHNLDVLLALSTHLTPDKWIAMVNENASHTAAQTIRCAETKKEATKFIQTTHWFQMTGDDELPSTPPLLPQDSEIPPCIQRSVSQPQAERELETVAGEKEIKNYSRERLNAKTVEKLKRITKKWRIKAGKTKDEYIELILKRVNTVHGDKSVLEQMNDHLVEKIWSKPAKIQDLYVANFNLVDVANKYWYMTDDKHPKRNWRIRFVLALLRFAIINAFTISAKPRNMTFVEFHKAMAVELFGTEWGTN